MATLFSRTFASRPLIKSATVLSVAGAALYVSRSQTPHLMDSGQNQPTGRTLSFPRTMVFSKQLRVVEVQQVNHDTKRIKFELPGGQKEVSGVTPGAAILTQHTPAGALIPVFRPYTPIHDLDEPGVLELLVKQYPNGKASSHLHSLTPGQSLTVRGPLPGSPALSPSSSPGRDILLVAGGAGITPIYSLTKGLLADGTDRTRIHLLWGVNGMRDIVLRDQLDALEKRYPDRLRVTYAVSGPECRPEAPGWPENAEKYRKGYVDGKLLREAMERWEGASNEKGTKVFLCGPPKMEEAVVSALAELGVGKKEVHRF